MVGKGNAKSPTKASEKIPLKKQYEVLGKIHIYNELSDQVKNYSISVNLPLSRMEDAIEYTINKMKEDNYLYKMVCPSHIKQRLDGHYFSNELGYTTEDSDSVLLEKEAQYEGLNLEKLKKECILSEEGKKVHKERSLCNWNKFSEKNIADLCKFICAHPIVDLSYRFNYCTNRDEDKKGKRCPCFCPFHEEFTPLFDPFFKGTKLNEYKCSTLRDYFL